MISLSANALTSSAYVWSKHCPIAVRVRPPADDDLMSNLTVSSRMSSEMSASVGNIERLEIKLEKERRRRVDLEKALERAQQPSLIG